MEVSKCRGVAHIYIYIHLCMYTASGSTQRRERGGKRGMPTGRETEKEREVRVWQASVCEEELTL